jgi:hypothetical protein
MNISQIVKRMVYKNYYSSEAYVNYLIRGVRVGEGTFFMA